MTTRHQRTIASRRKSAELHTRFLRFIAEVAFPALSATIDDRYALHMPGRHIRDTYGANEEAIFKLLFTHYQRGGTTESGVPFKTMWVAHLDNLRLFNDSIDKLSGQQYTAREVLADMLLRGAQQTQRVKFPDGEAIMLTTTTEVEEYKRIKRAFHDAQRARYEYNNATYF